MPCRRRACCQRVAQEPPRLRGPATISSHRANRGATPRSPRTVSRVPKVRAGLRVVAELELDLAQKRARRPGGRVRRQQALRQPPRLGESVLAHEARGQDSEAPRRCARCGARASAGRAPPPGPGPRSPCRSAGRAGDRVGPAARDPARRSGRARPGAAKNAMSSSQHLGLAQAGRRGRPLGRAQSAAAAAEAALRRADRAAPRRARPSGRACPPVQFGAPT